MKRLQRNYVEILPQPPDPQLLGMCRIHPSAVRVESALSQYRWCVENNVRSGTEYEVLRSFLEKVMTKSSVDELEVTYEQYAN